MRCRLEGDGSVDGGASCLLRHARSAVKSIPTPALLQRATVRIHRNSFQMPKLFVIVIDQQLPGPRLLRLRVRLPKPRFHQLAKVLHH